MMNERKTGIAMTLKAEGMYFFSHSQYRPFHRTLISVDNCTDTDSKEERHNSVNQVIRIFSSVIFTAAYKSDTI